ncbi:MAG TPA: CopG family antitoxin [Pyrinomonadaceae bacterium]|nr:CopG family antitoxin [Pyrinomonadaceae bacterium]
MAGNKAKHLPSFRSVDELVGFFDTHDMGDYWEQMPEADLEVKLKKSSRQMNAKYISNTGKPWTSMQVKQLRQLASQDTPTRVIGLKLGRTESAVRTKASKKGVSLKPKNQSRSLRRKK